MLVRLSYISTPIGSIVETVKAFLPNATNSNRLNNITSFLVVHPDFYYQTIEGPHSAVNTLYKKIINNPHHKNCYLLSYEVVTELKFPIWSLAVAALPVKHLDQAAAIKAADPDTTQLSEAGMKLSALIDAELAVQKYLKEWVD
jgi:hypothetical protein